MRAFVLVSTLLLAVSGEAALVDRGAPTLRLQQVTGFVPAPMARSLRCEVFYNRVEIVKNLAGVEIKETRPITIDTSALYALIDEAAKAKLEETRGPVDGPSSLYEGLQILPTDGTKSVILSEMNGGTGTLVTNPSPEANLLKRVLDDLCR